MSKDTFRKICMLLSCAYFAIAQDDHWSYENQAAWGGQCNTGRKQSPIKLSVRSSLTTPFPALQFNDYDTTLKGPLTIANNGHSVNLDFTITTNGNRPSINGGMLNDRFEALSVHFHWGSPNSKGSEHLINNIQFAVEMHIVHKNIRYATAQEAGMHKNGLAVLGVMFKEGDDPNRQYPGLLEILNTLPQLVNYSSEAPINGELEVGQLLGDLNTKKFYSYSGSLTTPPCSEAVTWFVFPEPLPIPAAQIAKFWNIRDEDDEYLRNNFRDIQSLNLRKIYYRSGSIFGPIIDNLPTLP